MMSETELKDAVIDMAQLFGWLVHHDRPARKGDRGWATHIQGNAGFPDLVLARGGRVLFVELKSETGKFTDEQFAWGLAIACFEGVRTKGGTHEYHEWRPSEWLDGTIEKVLKREGNR